MPPIDPVSFRRSLLRWYDHGRRALPWRDTKDPWHILVSEIMLQQTRVEAVLRYYKRFLHRFPTARALAQATEPDVLAAWSGLGYYSRARNLQRTAQITKDGFPSTWEAIRLLPGVGPYTAAAVASFAFDLPHAAVDGNVLRVVARLRNDRSDIALSQTRNRFARVADELLDLRRPGDHNQAMMELGATVCLPRKPLCLLCPVRFHCAAYDAGTVETLPNKRGKQAPSAALLQLAWARKGDAVLLQQRAPGERRMPGFWELPLLGNASAAHGPEPLARFRHTIVNTAYSVEVWETRGRRAARGMRWVPPDELARIPLTTITSKALAKVGLSTNRNTSARASGQ